MNLKFSSNCNRLKFGLFDSGVGGLSVLIELVELLKGFEFANNPEIHYLADTARCPYGTKSDAEIMDYVFQITSWFKQNDVNNLVMACNTSAAIAANRMRILSDMPVYDLIGLSSNQDLAKYSKIMVLATNATVNSRAFSQAILKQEPNLTISEIACPELVMLVESGNFDTNDARQILKKYVDLAIRQNCQAIILGCTHFPFLTNALVKLLPSNIDIINPAKYLAREIRQNLRLANVVNRKGQNCVLKFYTTGNSDNFKLQLKQCLNLTINHVEFIDSNYLEQLSNISNELNPAFINNINVTPKFAVS